MREATLFIEAAGGCLGSSEPRTAERLFKGVKRRGGGVRRPRSRETQVRRMRPHAGKEPGELSLQFSFCETGTRL